MSTEVEKSLLETAAAISIESPYGDVFSPDEKLQSEKLLENLGQGFHIKVGYEGYEGRVDEWIEVVTRYGSDLFFTSINMRSIPARRYQREYSVLEIDVRRRLMLPPGAGSATLEKWAFYRATDRGDDMNYRIQTERGGVLEETEFWRRYNESIVDEETTAGYSELRKEEIEKRLLKRDLLEFVFMKNDSPSSSTED